MNNQQPNNNDEQSLDEYNEVEIEKELIKQG